MPVAGRRIGAYGARVGATLRELSGTARVLLEALIVLLGIGHAWPALAEEIHLVYQAPPDCPDRDAFEHDVASRTDKATWAPRRAGVREIAVTITAAGGAIRGQLVISDPARPADRASREVPGATCEEVVEALALIAALAIDPAAELSPAPAPLEPPPRPVPLPKPTPEPARLPTPPPTPPPTEPMVPSSRWRWLVGLGLSATSGLGDKLAAVVPVYVEASLASGSWLAPSFRLGVAVMPDRVLTDPAGRGHLTRFAARVSGCPIRGDLTPWLVLRPCASFEAGALLARGEGVDEVESSASPWLAAGVSGRLQLFPSDWLMLEISGEGGLALVRPRFVIDPAIEVGEADFVLGVFGGSVGIRFP